MLKGATPELVEQATQQLLATDPSRSQGGLLATLGIFAEPLFSVDRFIRLVTRERLMSTDRISYLLEDKLAEFAREKAEYAQREAELEAALEREKATAEQRRFRETLQQMVEDAIIARFPSAPAVLVRRLRTINDPQRLEQLHRAALVAADLAEFERQLAAAIQNADA